MTIRRLTQELIRKLCDEAPERMDGYARKMLADPEFRTWLHANAVRAQAEPDGEQE